jgi:hypothetical protein
MKEREDGLAYLLVFSASAANPFTARKQGFDPAIGECADIFAGGDTTDREVPGDCSDRNASPMCQNGNRFFPLAKRPALDPY